MSADPHPNQAGLARPRPIPNRHDGPVHFSHPAEAAFAGLLDFYQIGWEYEPTTFPLEWDQAGNVVAAFAPDFYLVEDDVYVELTTMKQSLVTQKNRKLRLLHELYPDVHCRLMYRKDIMQLAVRYGLFEDGPLPGLPAGFEAGEEEDDE